MGRITIGLLFSIFMGITAVSLGVGAIHPLINGIAAPLVCPAGKLEYQQRVSNPLPGRTYVEAFWTCENEPGHAKPVSTFLVALYAGTFYGLLIFVFFWVIIRLRRSSRAQQ